MSNFIAVFIKTTYNKPKAQKTYEFYFWMGGYSLDYKDAKLYLALYNSSSLTKAAHIIGLTQSAVTQRLQKLEREFGMKLVIRERGQKYVELTNYGRRMVPILQQWVDLYESANSIKNEDVKTPLKIACTDSIGSYILPRFLLDYAQKHPDVMLSIHTSHSWEIFNMLEEGTIDVGVTNRESSLYHNELKVMPIYREPYRLLTSQQNAQEYEGGPVQAKKLDVARELFFEITPAFTQWRKTLWEDRMPFLQMSFAQMLPTMLVDTPYWTILPLSTACSFASLYPLKAYELSDGPEPRICSIVTQRSYRNYRTDQIELFVSELTEFFRSLESK